MSFVYHTPGYLDDFSDDLQAAWSTMVSATFDNAIASEDPPRLAFVNQARTPLPDPVFEQSVVWNALPTTLVNRYGRPQALALADYPYPLTRANEEDAPATYDLTGPLANCWYRAQDEYCEWRARRDANGNILDVTFTSEPPEYWMALHGDTVRVGKDDYPMPGDPDALLTLYHQYVSEEVELADLEFPADVKTANGGMAWAKGQYNPYNRWNSVDGIMHLSHPANYLSAEIQLGCDASVIYGRAGRRITDPLDLICAAGYGGVNRASDPTIGASVQALAALGFQLSLRDPVGLYMHHLNLAPFTQPNGSPISEDYFKVIRGDADQHLIERAVFAVPNGENFTVSDLRIGGEPVRFGAQIAEHMVVHLVAVAAAPGSLPVERYGPKSTAAVTLQPPTDVQYQRIGTASVPPRRGVFRYSPMSDASSGEQPEHAPAAAIGVHDEVKRHGYRHRLSSV